jgi:hypothetical protein
MTVNDHLAELFSLDGRVALVTGGSSGSTPRASTFDRR